MTAYSVFKYTDNPTAGTKRVFLKEFMDVNDAIEYHKGYEQTAFVWHTIEVKY
tara:strand:+ start:111 stop:269 length:159 start_codon:yes stop_codon:yes gene_type:complete